MSRKTGSRAETPRRTDALAFFEELTPYAPGGGRYTKIDRYRDFRAVLMDGDAAPDQARRVLWQIFEECRLFRTPIAAGDTHLTYTRIGKQEIGRWLLTVLTAEPGEGPARTEPEETA